MNRKRRQATYRRNKKKLEQYGELFLRRGLRTSFPTAGFLESEGSSSDDRPEENIPNVKPDQDVEIAGPSGAVNEDRFEDDANNDTDDDQRDQDDDDNDRNDQDDDDDQNDQDDDDDENDQDDDEDQNNQNNQVDDQDDAESGTVPFNIDDSLRYNLPLRGRSQVTARDHLLAILSLSIRHKLTYEATLDILRWMSQSHWKNFLPNTMDTFWKVLCRNTTAIKRHYYCGQCNGYLGEQLEMRCPCSVCGPHEPDTNLKYFLQLDITSQIKQLLSIPNIHKYLQYRFNRQKRRLDALEDIYDGEAYKKLCLPGDFLDNPNNFSLTFNTDGCNVSNSSNTSAWPIYAQINELPPHLRKKHMLLAGIYVDNTHSVLNQFLHPFVEESRRLFNDGISWNPSESNEVLSKFIVVIGCVDSPARASLIRMTQFNGRNGCLHCYAVGHSCGPGRFVYPVEQSFGQLRTHDEVTSDMCEALRTETTVRGMRGISCVTALPSYNVCDGTVVDSMHAAFLGVAKQHTRLLMESANQPYYIGNPNSIRIIDNILLSIEPPSRRSRTPRSLTSWKQWKASEWRNWLGYAPSCLEDILPVRYGKHIALLSEAIHYLNSDSITPEQLDRSEALLETYVRQFQQFFGIENMSFNIHLMTHITQCVRNWGPIWTHSAFVFESWNKKIIDRITSPHGRADQVACRFLMQSFVVSSIADSQMSREAQTFITKIMRIKLSVYNDDVPEVTIGKCLQRRPTRLERQLLLDEGYQPTVLYCYRALRLAGIRYTTDAARHAKRCDSVVVIRMQDLNFMTAPCRQI